MDPRVAANRALWDEWTPIHVRSEFYDVEGWKSGRRRDLHALLVEEVGDVAGKDLLHLQCHFGLDTLAWARRGARVTVRSRSSRAAAKSSTSINAFASSTANRTVSAGSLCSSAAANESRKIAIDGCIWSTIA